MDKIKIKCGGAIFDFDGTLYDSMDMWRTVGADFACERLGVEYDVGLARLFFSNSTNVSLRQLKRRFPLDMSYEALSDSFFDYLSERYISSCREKEGASELLKSLRSKGIEAVVATATGKTAVLRALEHSGMLGYFKAIVTTDEIGKDKTEPDVYRRALSLLGVPKDGAIVFEDAYYAALTAKRDGFRLVGVYDSSEKNADGLLALSDIYLESLSQAEIIKAE